MSRADPKRKLSKKRAARRAEDATRRLSIGSKTERIDFPPYYPIRALLDTVTRSWQLSLVDRWMRASSKNQRALPNLSVLARLLLREDYRDLNTLKRTIGPFLAPPPPQIELSIERIDPPDPSTWALDQEVHVEFTVRNNSAQPTSGFVQGSATQGILRSLMSSGWFRPETTVRDLPSGQAFVGTLKLGRWNERRLPGLVDISLGYWVEDRGGTITFVWGSPGDQHDATYRAVSVAQSSLGKPLSFANDIRPFFRDKDIEAMLFSFNLASYQDVKANAQGIYDAVAHPTAAFRMPCDGPWPADWVDTFLSWMDEGMPP
jgi:hypothetical protein